MDNRGGDYMASIQKKGNQFYVVTRINNKQRWIKAGVTKREAKKKLNEIEYKLNNNLYRDTSKIMFKDFINNWLDTYCNYNLKETTIRGYKSYINNYIIPRLGNYYIAELKPVHLQNFIYDTLENGRIKCNKPLNPKTVIQAVRVISKCLNSAVKLQLIPFNPASYVDLPRKKRYKYNWLNTKEEIQEFINSFSDTSLHLPVMLAVLLGLRRGEVLGLRWEDINFCKKTIYINRTVINGVNGVKIDTPKTEKSVRVLLLPDVLVNILYDIRGKNGYIFTYGDGSLINPASFSRKYIEYRDRKDLKKVRFQDLRHSNASFLYSQNVDIKKIQERLGHSTISTTMDIYTHTDISSQYEVNDKINSII